MAQNDSSLKSENKMTQYYIISVDFYSTGQGINNKAQDELFAYINKIQKKLNSVIFYERLRWGKEGEETIYMDVTDLPVSERQGFLDNLNKMFSDINKMAIVQANLYFEPAYNYLNLGILLYGHNTTRENAVLNYIDKYEKANKVKINHGIMINETGIIEDQDKRYQFDLMKLTESKRTEIVEKTKELMHISLPKTLEIDFIGIGGANDRAYKGYLEAFISKFEKNNKISISYNSQIYEMNQGGELYTIQLQNMSDTLKIQFVKDVGKLCNQANLITIRMY